MAGDNAKLDACPHCGKADAFVERSDLSACHVVCNECGARGPVCCDETDADAAASENDHAELGELAARRAWNTRAAPPAMDREAVDFLGMVGRLTHSGDDGWTPDDADDATHALDGLIAKARTIANAAPVQSDASIWDSYRLPCDVHLAPVTIIRAGCQLSTLKVAMEAPHRPRHFEGHPNAALSTLSADAIRQGEGLRALSDRATPGPWSWEQCGEMEDVPVVGIAFPGDDPDCKAPYEGEFRDSDANRMTIAFDWQSCDGHSPSANAAFAVAAVNFVCTLLATPASHASDGGKA